MPLQCLNTCLQRLVCAQAHTDCDMCKTFKHVAADIALRSYCLTCTPYGVTPSTAAWRMNIIKDCPAVLTVLSFRGPSRRIQSYTLPPFMYSNTMHRFGFRVHAPMNCTTFL
jgi:hypothetical protein